MENIKEMKAKVIAIEGVSEEIKQKAAGKVEQRLINFLVNHNKEAGK